MQETSRNWGVPLVRSQQTLQSRRYQGAELYCPSEFGGRFFPRQVSVWKCAAQPTPGLQFWETLRTSEAVPGLLILRNCDSCIDFSCQVQSYFYVAPLKRVHQQLLARFRKWLTYKILDRGQTNSCIYLLFQLEHHLSDSRLPSPAR